MISISTVFVVAKNFFSGRMNRSIVGKTISGEYILTPPECAEFARALRDPRRSDPLFVSPFIFARIFLEPVKRILFDPAAGVNLVRMVHGNVSARWLRPFRAERPYHFTLSVHDIDETPAGEILVFSGRIYDGEDLVAEISSGFPVRVKKRAPRPPKDEPSGGMTLLHILDVVTDRKQPPDYARASGDMNPIHRSALFARVAGFRRPIMHGMCVMGMCERVIVNKLTGDAFGRARAIEGRFSSPVMPGERLTVRVYEPLNDDDGKKYPYEVLNGKGMKVIKNGTLAV